MKNTALLFKWWWRYGTEEGILWRRVVNSVHNEDECLLPNAFRLREPGLWRDIKKLASEEGLVQSSFKRNLKLNLGDGRKVRFRDDIWEDHESLRKLYPELYKLSSQKKCVVADMGWFEGHCWVWCLTWIRELNEHEKEKEQELKARLMQHYPENGVADSIEWAGAGCYTVKEMIRQAKVLARGGVIIDSVVSKAWLKIAPTRVELMVWMALVGKLNTRTYLKRRGALSEEQDICPFCDAPGEDIDHLFLRCGFTAAVWHQLQQEWGSRIPPTTNFKL